MDWLLVVTILVDYVLTKVGVFILVHVLHLDRTF
jgi:hypothetical protein